MPSSVSPSLSPPLSPSGPGRRVAIIGGGISGLAAAHRLTEVSPGTQVTLFEASSRLGGVLQTDEHDGWLIERSADMFTTREPWALDLCRRIGIADELIETDRRFRRAFVVRGGRLVPVPEGFTLMSPARFWPILRTPILSPLGKLRLAAERFIPARRDETDESLESFVTRRFGREAFDRLIQPLIGGIYTADPARLSMAATLPQFVAMERRYGSLIRGMRVQGSGFAVQESGGRGSRRAESSAAGNALRGVPGASEGRPMARGVRQPPEASAAGGQESGGSESGAGVRYGQFLAPAGGMQRIVDALAARLPPDAIRLNAAIQRVHAVEESRGGWRVELRGESSIEHFDDVILAAPAAISSRLMGQVDPLLAGLIERIPYAGCSVAIVGVRREQVAHPLDGFGFVVPAIERRKILAGSMASIKFPGRAPEGKVLLRVFVGGALQPELATLPDDEIRNLVVAELRELIGLAGDPEFCDVARWQAHMPQYHVGHLELVGQIEQRAAAIPHFALAGNAYRGVGIPFCIRSGELAAERIVSHAGVTAAKGESA